jgi:hypothetical protein
MKSNLLAVFATIGIASVASAGVVSAFPDEIDFEGLADQTQIPDGYADMNWSTDFYVLDADAYGTDSGYKVMGSTVALNWFEASPVSFQSQDGSEFNLVSLDFIAAWYTELTYTVNGYRDGGLEYSKDITVDCFNVSTFDLNYSQVDEVEFVFKSSNFVVGWDGGSGTHFALDNIVIPAPATIGLLGLGLIGRRRR